MGVEIERVFLLRCRPTDMPVGDVWRIEQGYLKSKADPKQPLSEGGACSEATPLSEGRLRRIVHADGREEFVHTVKSGVGLVRQEVERPISAAAFAEAWPRTAGRRLSKQRTRIRQGSLTWEVDEFDGLPLVLAECELPRTDADMPIPGWLAPFIEREVTEEPAFRNYELARRACGGQGPSGPSATM